MHREPEVKTDSREVLILEYESLLAGYHSRDESMSRTFHEMTQVFAFFFALILGVKFIEPRQTLLVIVYLVLSVAGVLALLAFLVDLQGISSSKNALRERCTKLEAEFGTDRPHYWNAIAHRKKFVLESLMKPYTPEGMRELRVGGFGYLAAAQAIFWLWVVLIGSVWFLNVKF
jgi:hypothetical protein